LLCARDIFMRCLLTALRSGCPPGLTHLSFPLDMRYRAGVRSRSFDSQISQSAPPSPCPL
jgi:hypothetical protein